MLTFFHRNGTVANVEICDLDLNCQDREMVIIMTIMDVDIRHRIVPLQM